MFLNESWRRDTSRVTGKRLAKVADPEALDKADGPRGRLAITVPQAWLATGAKLRLQLPRLVPCDLCGAGGCDMCERSGAYRVDGEQAIPLSLPRGTPDNALIRIADPCGGVDQLLVEISAGPVSKSVTRTDLVAPDKSMDVRPIVAAAIALALLLLFLLRS